ncbi:pyridoxal phosphate-dependent aminotransferase [Fibrobacter sp.]|uniref:pyridoxal phosphate-dependent aminotransferase n=1 Tax=Fibrobacter sp. TaxID=35828 RepID=UPI0026093ECD|nr:pyridoxal phosphate-dependent aminotransferase [Fibrobacter sp.]MDD5941949.1 pyridoxal phosphate-dependent aminotransferase [Fibrobacter sp.]
MFSSRLPKDISPSPFFAELERVKACAKKDAAEGGLSFIDMTVSSPVRAGLPIDLNAAVDEGRESFGCWNPDAAGWKSVRETVVEYYRERSGNFTAGQIILTASTSEAYSVLFKTFCDPGDVILTPMPGYPLLDTLAQLEHLECAPYFLKLTRERLRGPSAKLRDLKKSAVLEPKANHKFTEPAEVNSFRYVLDTDSLLAAPERAKILLLVSPHNPTGHCISREEWNAAVRFCEENDMILVVDEVFGDYAFMDKVKHTWEYVFGLCPPEPSLSQSSPSKSFSTEGRESVHCRFNDFWDAGGGDFINLPENGPKCPIFWLNGLSKAVGSPQLKLGWMAFYAPRERFEEIRAALEFVEDAYLSVSAPAQALGSALLKQSAAYESQVKERLLANWQTLREAFPSKYCPDVLGGWYAVVRLGEDDEDLTLRLLCEKHVLVQPGFFFDFDEDGWVVISLLQEPALFKEAVRRMADR